MKTGRNDPCWCGSGQKFKRCHLGRESEERAKPWEVTTEFRKDFSKKLCSAPEILHDQCSGTIVAAHTVPRSGSLNKIAEKIMSLHLFLLLKISPRTMAFYTPN